MRRIIVPIAIAVALVVSPLHADDAKVFRAGAATSNITPDIGEPLVGGFVPEKSLTVHDELHARAIVLDDGRKKIGIVVCDNLGMAREVCDEARRRAAEATGIPVECILLSATHTHSGPSARWLSVAAPGGELSDYAKFLIRRVSDALVRAVHNLEPARVGWGVAENPRQVFNRRWHMKPGPQLENPFGGVDQVRMNPPAGSPDLLEPAGPTDPEIVFLSVEAVDGRPLALVANYSLHYVGGVGKGHISADYFAMFADRVKQLLEADRLDPPFVAAMTNGTSGDINNINFRQPRPRGKPYELMREVAWEVADDVVRAHKSIKFHDWVPLDSIQKPLTLATRRPTPELIERAKKVLDGDLPTSHVREKNYAERTLVMATNPPEITIQVQAFRIGELGIATSPFETFCETGLEIKRRSPFKPTCTIELAGGAYGYLPTPEQHRLGGYETWLGTNRVEPNASRKLTELLVSMLDELKSRESASSP